MSSELFTVSFWQVTIARGISAAASGALALLAPSAVSAAAPETHISVPWYAVLGGAGVSGLCAVLFAVASAQITPTAAGKIAALMPKPGQVLEVRHRDAPGS